MEEDRFEMRWRGESIGEREMSEKNAKWWHCLLVVTIIDRKQKWPTKQKKKVILFEWNCESILGHTHAHAQHSTVFARTGLPFLPNTSVNIG